MEIGKWLAETLAISLSHTKTGRGLNIFYPASSHLGAKYMLVTWSGI